MIVMEFIVFVGIMYLFFGTLDALPGIFERICIIIGIAFILALCGIDKRK